MSVSIFNVQNFSKVVGSVEGKLIIFYDFFFDFVCGDSLVIVGSFGFGKLILFGLFVGFDQFSGGEVCLVGYVFGDFDEDQWVCVCVVYVGFVFQLFQLFDSFDVLENVMLFLELEGCVVVCQCVRELFE